MLEWATILLRLPLLEMMMLMLMLMLTMTMTTATMMMTMMKAVVVAVMTIVIAMLYLTVETKEMGGEEVAVLVVSSPSFCGVFWVDHAWLEVRK